MNKDLINMIKNSGFPLRQGYFYTPVQEHLPLDYHLNLLVQGVIERCVEVCRTHERQYQELQRSTDRFRASQGVPEPDGYGTWTRCEGACNLIATDLEKLAKDLKKSFKAEFGVDL